MTEHQWKTFWSILVCLAIVMLIGLVAVQQSWVKRRPIEAGHEHATEQLVQPRK
jgi:hypothetical protein